MLGESEYHVGVDPRVIVARVLLPGSMDCFAGEKHLEFIRHVFVVRECRIGQAECEQGASNQDSCE
jgi:hypothetical protein